MAVCVYVSRWFIVKSRLYHKTYSTVDLPSSYTHRDTPKYNVNLTTAKR